VLGFACPRSEVSGQRFWGWARERFGTAEAFFERFFVWNYCPLVFMEESARNRTPDKLPVAEKEPLFTACDRALVETVEALRPARIIGVGKFAERRAKETLQAARIDLPVGSILHPSPASPAANRGWAEQAERQLEEMGVGLP
jgi:single-strand selective monofunctional uracil DNA glycosylase